MTWSLKLNPTVKVGLVRYRNIFREMEEQKRQTEISIYFHISHTLSVLASPASPSTSSASAPLRKQDQSPFPPPP